MEDLGHATYDVQCDSGRHGITEQQMRILANTFTEVICKDDGFAVRRPALCNRVERRLAAAVRDVYHDPQFVHAMHHLPA